jgi:hypothetical protein
VLSLVVTGKNHADLDAFIASNLGLLDAVSELRLVVPGALGQARVGNHAKATALGDVVGLVHSDVSFQSGDLGVLEEAARKAVAGIVGARLLEPEEQWDRKFTWGKSLERTTEVSTLDGCSVFFRKDLPVSFDESFQGWHCVVEDFCLSAKRAGMPVVVAPVKASHQGGSTFDPSWQRQYAVGKEHLLRKWSGTRFETT